MNFLQVSLTNRCNFGCPTCPMGKWRNSAAPRWPLCNAELMPFLEKYVNPDDWVIELTGGEPSLYPEIDELMMWLSACNYRTLVKTNGSGNLLHLRGITICAAFHDLKNPPKNYDRYLIIDRLQREAKEAYCIEHGIPYKVIGFNKENPDGATHGFKDCAFINPAGHQVGCCARRPVERVVNGIDYNRIDRRPLVVMDCCPHCKAAIDAWRFL